MLNISRLGSLIASSVMVVATLRSAVLTSVSKPSPVPSALTLRIFEPVTSRMPPGVTVPSVLPVVTSFTRLMLAPPMSRTTPENSSVTRSVSARRAAVAIMLITALFFAGSTTPVFPRKRPRMPGEYCTLSVTTMLLPQASWRIFASTSLVMFTIVSMRYSVRSSAIKRATSAM